MDDLMGLTDLLAREVPGLATHPAFSRLRTGISRASSQANSPPPTHGSPTRSDASFDDPFVAGPSRHSPNSPPPLSITQSRDMSAEPEDQFSYLFSPGPLSPAPSSRSPSPTPSSGKRKRAHLDSDGGDEREDDDEDEGNNNNAPKKKKKKGSSGQCRNDGASGKLRKQDKLARLRGGAGSETPEAERKAGDLRDAGGDDESPSKAKAKGPFVGDGTPPKTTAKGGEFLSELSRIASKEGQDELESFIVELVEFYNAPVQNVVVPGSRTEEIIHTLRCPGDVAKNGEKMIKKGRLLDFHTLLMYTRFRLAMHNDGMIHQVRAEKMGFTDEKSSRNYVQRGQRILDLAGGGTFYILIIAAALGLKDRITGLHLNSADFRSCGNALRDPRENDSWGNSARVLFPYIHRLYHDPRLNFLTFGAEIFSEEEMDAEGVRFSLAKLNFKEISYNDSLLSRLKTNSEPLRPRAPKIWDRIFIPPVFPLPPVGPKVYPTERIRTSIRIPQGSCPVPKDRTAAKQWVERERETAEKGSQVASCDELKQKLESIHSDIERNPDTYVRFDSKLLNGKALSIHGIAGPGEIDDDVVLILTDMRDTLGPIVDSLPDLINAAYGDGTIHSDSRAEGFAVDALHLEPAYNRFTEKGKGAPLEEHHMHFIHRENYERANHGQRIPWVSKDIIKDQDSYAALVSVLTGMCEYLADRLCHHRPELVGNLEAYINILPYNASCPWAPFGGIVVNFNACSDAHLDGWDLFKRCIVVPLMRNCKGGALVLHEARLVLDLHTADVVLFPSGRFTHFNLHYVGMRASLVFHTDAGGRQWTEGEGANEWLGKFGVKLDRPS
ncbi:hypothetical protein B0H16DRAFT_1442511 [Mycena metata]|uniref:Uncharacterized protein n=1 Tax=Mycena metata TaxID=1033252 RepID=A0AAD7DSK5_9AGAR|nr:hypothetical protein B0H16DRAFT_1442511 [Mycena metata]